MKKAIGPLLCLALCLALAACGGEAQSTASSTHAALPGGGAAAPPASSAAQSAAVPEAAASSGAAQGVAAQAVTAMLADGSGSAALTLPVPEGWQLDGYTTFMQDGRKVLELSLIHI